MSSEGANSPPTSPGADKPVELSGSEEVNAPKCPEAVQPDEEALNNSGGSGRSQPTSSAASASEQVTLPNEIQEAKGT